MCPTYGVDGECYYFVFINIMVVTGNDFGEVYE